MRAIDRAIGVTILSGIVGCVAISRFGGPVAESETGGVVREATARSEPVAAAGFHGDRSVELAVGLAVGRGSAVVDAAPARAGTAVGVDVASDAEILKLQRWTEYLADFNGDRELSDTDRAWFDHAFRNEWTSADLNGDGAVDLLDTAMFMEAFDAREQRPYLYGC